MIFVTIGTSEPFDRLLDAVPVVDERVVVQAGRSRVQPKGAEIFDFLPFDDVDQLMREARVIVMHAGVGSVLAAVRNGKRPLVVPRLRRFGEAVDDHQLEFARRLDGRGLVRLVEDPQQLAAAVAQLGKSAEISVRPPLLATEIRAYVREQVRPRGAPAFGRIE
jgi:UDP-N-acetylglucosamine transferase subunit ALG13